MKIKLSKKKLVVVTTMFFVLVFVVVLGASYSYFTHSVTGKNYVIKTGALSIDYLKKTNVISIENAYPMTNTEGLTTTPHEFSVTNNGTIDGRYQVRLEVDDTSKNMIDIENIKLSYSLNGSSYTEPVLLSNLNSNLVFISDEVLRPTEVATIGIKLWIDINATNDIQGKEFKARIVVDSIQNVEDGYVVDTKPIIYLNKDESGNQDIHLVKGDSYQELGIEKVVDDKDILTPSQVDVTYEYYDGTNLSTVSSIDTSKTGIYYVTYSITDSANNTSKSVRVVTINNTKTIPTITLKGEYEISIYEGVKYVESGVTVENDNQVVTVGEVNISAPGVYIIRYIVIDKDNNLNSVTRTVIVNKVEVGTVIAFDYVEDENGNGYGQEFTVPVSGQYKIETWGAQGGGTTIYIGGYGGNSTGFIQLIQQNKIFINIGGQGGFGLSYANPGGYNGGGYSGDHLDAYSYGGGGATHIALVDGLLSELSNNTSDILIIAGGGGGATSGSILIAGCGGGYIGCKGNSTHPLFNNSTYLPLGGTQEEAGYGYEDYRKGGFGYATQVNTSGWGGGGGSGLYGGGTGLGGTGAGGSGYIGNSLLSNGIMYCYDCEENDGTENPSYKTVSTTGSNADTTNCPDGYGESPISKCAKAGNGYAKITYLGQ